MNIKDLKGIKSLIQLMSDSDLTEITLEEDAVKLTLKRDRVAVQEVVSAQPAPVMQQAATIQVPVAAATEVVAEDSGLHQVTAPLVGTFYASPAPDADLYVKIGDKVKKGQTLCIIEAMKLMNEIESDMDGTVVEMLAKNASPVDFGAPLFSIKPN